MQKTARFGEYHHPQNDRNSTYLFGVARWSSWGRCSCTSPTKQGLKLINYSWIDGSLKIVRRYTLLTAEAGLPAACGGRDRRRRETGVALSVHATRLSRLSRRGLSSSPPDNFQENVQERSPFVEKQRGAFSPQRARPPTLEPHNDGRHWHRALPQRPVVSLQSGGEHGYET